MRRKTFDALATAVGLALAVVLLIAGGLLLWGHNFVDTQVHNQLAAQQIFFPANNSPAIKAPEFAAMHQYAGQQMTTGAQAEVYADHFIANHLKAIGGGQPTHSSPQSAAPAHEHQARGPGRDDVQGRDPARAAAERLRLRHDGHARRDRRDRGLRRSGRHAAPQRPGHRTPAAGPAEAEIFAKVITPNGKAPTPTPVSAS